MTLDDPLWYDRVQVGEGSIDTLMKTLSEDAVLSDSYTNHSIRKMVLCTLDEHGFLARHIMFSSSHKSESTIKEYATNCPEPIKRGMCNALTDKIIPAKKPKPQPSHTMPSPNGQEILAAMTPDQDITNFDLLNANILPLDISDQDNDLLVQLLNHAEELEKQ